MPDSKPVTDASTQKPVDGDSPKLEAPSPRWLRLLFCLLVLCALVLSVCLFREPILNGLGSAWMVNEPVRKADAIVVLGGGAQFRSFAAARLYSNGVAPRVLVMNSELRTTDIQGFTMPEAELVRRVLETNGVPSEAITWLGTNLTSTYEEAVTLRNYLRTNAVGTIQIPTGAFQARRARWIFRRQLAGNGTLVRVSAIDPTNTVKWWKSEKVFLDFQNELVKSAYYLLRY